MALPSQTARAQTWRSSSSSSSPLAAVKVFIRENKPIVIGAAVVVVACGGYLYYKGHTPAATIADTGKGDTFLPAGQSPQVATKPLADPAPKPTNISMGMLNEPAPSSKPSPDKSVDELVAQAGSKPKADPTEQPSTTPTAPAPSAGGQPGSSTPAAPTKPAGIADPTAAPEAAPTAGGSDARTYLDQAARLIQQNNPLDARKLLNDALMNPAISADGRGSIRAQLSTINETLFFSPTPYKGDPITDEHAVASGESLAKIVRKEGLPIDWRLLVRINKMPSEGALRIGQKLKIVRQPLHAVVHKTTYRMDIYAGPPISGTGSPGPDGQEPGWTYIRSFRVGLGADNGTPEGLYVVKANSKLVNPKWVNPRTGEVFQPDDPKNPIGERWIGLEGVDDNTRRFAGYGVHGTIDPDSVGQQKSMGCIRLLAPDIEIVYEMLVDKVSTVKVIP